MGSLRSRRGVVLRPEVSGRITALNFTDGQRVRKGQVLVQFDDQLPLAQVQQSQAELSIALANQKRNQELVAQNFISQRTLDESAANLQVAQAKLALAQASLARLRILAPFDGIVGIRSVNVGDYLIGLGYRLVSRETASLGPEVAADILDRLAEAHMKLSEGQGAELLRGDRDPRAGPATKHEWLRESLLHDHAGLCHAQSADERAADRHTGDDHLRLRR